MPNLGTVPFSDLVHFFYTPGILSLPYQFYHHAHNVLCDHDQSEKLFLFDTDPVKCNAARIITLGTRLTVPLRVLYCKA